jgi:hypothetical protein
MRFIGVLTFATEALSCTSGLAQNLEADTPSGDYRKLTYLPVTSPVGDKQQLENLALAFKQMDAIEQASIASQCSIRFQRPPAS